MFTRILGHRSLLELLNYLLGVWQEEQYERFTDWGNKPDADDLADAYKDGVLAGQKIFNHLKQSASFSEIIPTQYLIAEHYRDKNNEIYGVAIPYTQTLLKSFNEGLRVTVTTLQTENAANSKKKAEEERHPRLEELKQ